MPKLTAEQEKFLKDYREATTRQLTKLSAYWLRKDLKSGAMKYSELTPSQMKMLDEYPEEETEDGKEM